MCSFVLRTFIVGKVALTEKCSQGLVLADSKDRKSVVVEEVVPGGNADKSGQVKVGDIVSK
jgi:C-terminal processing protease CtpA/Prc